MQESLAQLVTCGIGEGTTFKACTICDIWVLADKIVNFVWFLATPILIIILIVGGFIYLTSGGNPKKTEQAKSLLTSAIVGIVISLAAFFIVDTILKTLVRQDFTWPSWNTITTSSCPKPLEPTPVDLSKLPKPIILGNAGTLASEEEARNALEGFSGVGERVSINKRPCACSLRNDPRCADCTNTAGLPASTINYLRLLQEYCASGQILNCKFVLSGGTESHLHSENTRHAPGNTVVDVVPNTQTQAIYQALISAAQNITTTARCENRDSETISTCAVPSTNHIHFEFRR